MYHVPVLLKESIDWLITDPGGTYVDLTFGGGGHSREILNRLNENGNLFAFDQDEDAFRNAPEDARFELIRSNFRFFENFLTFYKRIPVTGILADLGVSSHQFDTANRGFSFRFEAELDMRMDQSAKITAASILNEYPAEKLQDIFFQYGEIKSSKLLAAHILRFREEKPILSTADLSQAIKGVWKPNTERELLPQIYQALRIEVNDELGALKDMLKSTDRSLATKGRLVVISYHSLEDRLVKHYIKSGNFDGKVETDLFGRALVPFKLPKQSALKPDTLEINQNPRARSAKLRVAEKI